MPKRARRRRTLRRGPWWLRVIASIKRNPIKTLTAVFVLLGSIVPAIKGINWLDENTDGWQFARHAFVYEQVGGVDKKATTLGVENQHILRDLQIDTANGKLASTVNDIKKWELELSKAKDQVTIDLINQQIDALKQTQSAVADQLKTLHKVKPAK